MHRRTVLTSLIGVGLAISPLAAGAATPTGHRALPRSHVLVPRNLNAALPRQDAAVASLNWSGYAVLPAAGQAITSVSANFVVPAVSALPAGFAAIWTGIGGYNTSDLIQAGVGTSTLPNSSLLGPRYYAWIETLPAGEQQIANCTGDRSCAVRPGDQIGVNIRQLRPGTWLISLSDRGRWSWTRPVGYASTRSSAEWILEAPTLVVQTTLANVGTVRFVGGNTFAVNGVSRKIAQGHPVSITLGAAPGLPGEALPSTLDRRGDGFDSCAYALRCPAPIG